MYSFEFEGKKYRSIREACVKLGVSESLIKRLIRHYSRARYEPKQAFLWALKKEQLTPSKEGKTENYHKDCAMAAQRMKILRVKRTVKSKKDAILFAYDGVKFF